jgi:hypothetical protein
MKEKVGFAKDIRPMFTDEDIEHMRPFDVLLDDYAWMSDPAGGSLGNSPTYSDHGNARAVYSYLTGETSPQMPLGAPPWDKVQLSLYERWMNDGFIP